MNKHKEAIGHKLPDFFYDKTLSNFLFFLGGMLQLCIVAFWISSSVLNILMSLP